MLVRYYPTRRGFKADLNMPEAKLILNALSAYPSGISDHAALRAALIADLRVEIEAAEENAPPPKPPSSQTIARRRRQQ